MANENTQEILDGILEGLRSDDRVRLLDSIRELEANNFSSEAIRRQLEKLALTGDKEIQQSAITALAFKTNRYIASRNSALNRNLRETIIKQIENWEMDGIIQSIQAVVLKQRYNFDVTPLPSRPTPAPVPEKESTLIQPAIPAGPCPSLLQTLLSEASIKTYLYLGAFFVIAAALILAAVVDAARLPILGITTLAFGGGAFVIRKRLPQPSFALFIVFSFLLLIDANALETALALSGAVRGYLLDNHIFIHDIHMEL